MRANKYQKTGLVVLVLLSGSVDAKDPGDTVLPTMQNPVFDKLKSSGLNLSQMLIPTEFRCYRPPRASIPEQADFQIQVTNSGREGRYRTIRGDGKFASEFDRKSRKLTGKLVWLSGPLAGAARDKIHFTNYGQNFALRNPGGLHRGNHYCYQQGASETRARTIFKANTPIPGQLTCLAIHGKVAARPSSDLFITDDSNYSLNGRKGRYRVDTRQSLTASSPIVFESGPLKAWSASYLQETGSGFRWVLLGKPRVKALIAAFGEKFASGIRKAVPVRCGVPGDPPRIARFGDKPAPSVAPGKLSGWRARFIGARLSVYGKERSYYKFYSFHPNGYVYIGEASAAADVDCTRTRPNGSPVCATYLESGESVVITGANGRKTKYRRKAFLRMNKPQVPFIGHFRANEFFSSGASCRAGCFTSYSGRHLILNADGSFVRVNSKQDLSSSSVQAPISPGKNLKASSFAANSGTEEFSGRYEVQGNELVLHYPLGKVARHFFIAINQNTFQMGGWTYSRWTRKSKTGKTGKK